VARYLLGKSMTDDERGKYFDRKARRHREIRQGLCREIYVLQERVDELSDVRSELASTVDNLARIMRSLTDRSE
jgi:hypothetical protein